MRVICISNYRHEQSNTLRCSRNITPSGRRRPSLAEKRNETKRSFQRASIVERMPVLIASQSSNTNTNHAEHVDEIEESPSQARPTVQAEPVVRAGWFHQQSSRSCCFVLLGRSVCNSRWTFDYERNTEFLDYSRFLQSTCDFIFFESTGRYAFQHWYLFANIRQWFVPFRHWRTTENACSYLFRQQWFDSADDCIWEEGLTYSLYLRKTRFHLAHSPSSEQFDVISDHELHLQSRCSQSNWSVLLSRDLSRRRSAFSRRSTWNCSHRAIRRFLLNNRERFIKQSKSPIRIATSFACVSNWRINNRTCRSVKNWNWTAFLNSAIIDFLALSLSLPVDSHLSLLDSFEHVLHSICTTHRARLNCRWWWSSVVLLVIRKQIKSQYSN